MNNGSFYQEYLSPDAVNIPSVSDAQVLGDFEVDDDDVIVGDGIENTVGSEPIGDAEGYEDIALEIKSRIPDADIDVDSFKGVKTPEDFLEKIVLDYKKNVEEVKSFKEKEVEEYVKEVYGMDSSDVEVMKLKIKGRLSDSDLSYYGSLSRYTDLDLGDKSDEYYEDDSSEVENAKSILKYVYSVSKKLDGDEIDATIERFSDKGILLEKAREYQVKIGQERDGYSDRVKEYQKTKNAGIIEEAKSVGESLYSKVEKEGELMGIPLDKKDGEFIRSLFEELVDMPGSEFKNPKIYQELGKAIEEGDHSFFAMAFLLRDSESFVSKLKESLGQEIREEFEDARGGNSSYDLSKMVRSRKGEAKGSSYSAYFGL